MRGNSRRKAKVTKPKGSAKAKSKPPAEKLQQPTKAERDQVSIAAGGGMPDSDIACALGISTTQLREIYAHELSAGAFKSRMNLIVAQHSAGMKGNTAAAKSYLSLEPRNGAPPPPGQEPEPPPEKLGKKAQANVTAQTAQVGSAWEKLLPRSPVQ